MSRICGKNKSKNPKYIKGAIIDYIHNDPNDPNIALIRISTGKQDVDRQQFLEDKEKYPTNIRIIGSAFLESTAVDEIISLYNKERKNINLHLVALDRLVSNVSHLWKLHNFLLANDYKLSIYIVNNSHKIEKEYDLVRDIEEIQKYAKIAYSERLAKSKRMKWMHANNRFPKREPNPALVNFRRYAAHIFDKEGNYIPPKNLSDLYKSAGVKISENQIRVWRRKYDAPVSDSFYAICDITGLKLITAKEKVDEDFSYLIYEDYIATEETAKEFAKLNTHIIWKDDDVDIVTQAIGNLDFQDQEMSEAGAASDILEDINEAYKMYKEGILTQEEFQKFKNSKL